MSEIFDEDSFKAKIRRLTPRMQEAFLRAAEKLYEKESQIMLRLIMESRAELNNTAAEIRQEQVALKVTSNEIARQRQEEIEADREKLKTQRRHRKGEYIPCEDDSINSSDSSDATLTIVNESPRQRVDDRIASPRNRPPPNQLPPLVPSSNQQPRTKSQDRSVTEGNKPRQLNRLDSDVFALPGKIPGRKKNVCESDEFNEIATRPCTLSPLPEPRATSGNRPSSGSRARSPVGITAPLAQTRSPATSKSPRPGSSSSVSPAAQSPREFRPMTSSGAGLQPPIRSISPNSRPSSSPSMGRAIILSPERLEQEKEVLMQDLQKVGTKLEFERQRQAEKMEQRKHQKMQRKEENEELVNSLLQQTMDAFERKAQDKERQGAKMKEILLEKKRRREATELGMRPGRETTALSIRSVVDDDFGDSEDYTNELETVPDVESILGELEEEPSPPPSGALKKRTSVFKMSLGDVG